MHLLSESGTEPLFCLIDASGEYHAVNGTWSLPNLNRMELATQERKAPDGTIIPIEAVPPAVKKGETVAPMTFTIRNIHSPDAERFRIEQGLDAVKESIDPKFAAANALTSEERRRITVGSCVTKFDNMVAEDEEGKGVAMAFTAENLLQLFVDYDPALSQVDLFAGDVKKFESRS